MLVQEVGKGLVCLLYTSVTSVRAGRCLHAYKGSGSHLSPGHTIDGIVDEDDGDV